MALVVLDHASLAYGHWPLLDHADFVLEPNERVGLIGRNGVGKSTLLRVLAGLQPLDDGRMQVQSHTNIVYLAQEPTLEGTLTTFEAVAQGLGPLREALIEYRNVVHALERAGNDETLLDRLHALHEQLDANDGWVQSNRIETVLSALELDGAKPVAELSGGWRKRVALAQALARRPDVLLLDEPTNHLDFAAIEWLEKFLADFEGTVVFVTHDRRFLDRVATRIVELDRGVLRSFPGSFSTYRSKKEAMIAAELQEAARFDKLLAQEEVWIRKGIEARRTRNEGRVRRLEQLRVERLARRERAGDVRLKVDSGSSSGKLVAEFDNVSKVYAGRTVIGGFSATIMRGDRVGILGDNGAGKTTLLKLLLGEIEPDRGSVRRGTKLQVAYFDQLREQLDEEATLADTISPGSEFVEIGGARKHVIGYLEEFLFPPQRARSPVKSLSGGERNRLLLARLFARPANVLVLDEPTNDLDLDTLELLEDLLTQYRGTLLLVSHDREFIENIVTQVIAHEGAGQWREYSGGYDDWLRTRTAEAKRATKASPKAQTAAPSTKQDAKLSYKEKQELDTLPGRIEQTETQLQAAVAALGSPDLYAGSDAKIRAAQLEHDRLASVLEGLYARWETLEQKRALSEGAPS